MALSSPDHHRLVLAGGTRVAHIMARSPVVPATLTPGVRALDDGTLCYPAPDDVGAARDG
ncbi:MAG TPA: hypothetical protein VFW04_10395 [Gemmatimonadaceae bacterium]|nr:hypothetical protein [Gemmatimonadaceae bacterium]